MYGQQQCGDFLVQAGDFDGDPCTTEVRVTVQGIPGGSITTDFFFASLVIEGGSSIVWSGGLATLNGNNIGYDCSNSCLVTNTDLIAAFSIELAPGECMELLDAIGQPNGYLTFSPFFRCDFPFSGFEYCAPSGEEFCGVIQNGYLNCQDSDDNGIVGTNVTVVDIVGML